MNTEQRPSTSQNQQEAETPIVSPDPPIVRVENPSARYWEILQINIDWLRFSESKAGIILTVYGVIFTMGYTNATAVFSSLQHSGFLGFLICVYGLMSLASIGFCFSCLNPNLKNLEESSSIIYFGHISKKHKEFKEYKIYAQSVLDNEDKFTDHITEQIYVNSRLAWKKFTRVSWALRLFIFSLVVLLIALCTYLTSSLNTIDHG
jgi:hypothetical protein